MGSKKLLLLLATTLSFPLMADELSTVCDPQDSHWCAHQVTSDNVLYSDMDARSKHEVYVAYDTFDTEKIIHVLKYKDGKVENLGDGSFNGLNVRIAVNPNNKNIYVMYTHTSALVDSNNDHINLGFVQKGALNSKTGTYEWTELTGDSPFKLSDCVTCNDIAVDPVSGQVYIAYGWGYLGSTNKVKMLKLDENQRAEPVWKPLDTSEMIGDNDSSFVSRFNTMRLSVDVEGNPYLSFVEYNYYTSRMVAGHYDIDKLVGYKDFEEDNDMPWNGSLALDKSHNIIVVYDKEKAKPTVKKVEDGVPKVIYQDEGASTWRLDSAYDPVSDHLYISYRDDSDSYRPTLKELDSEGNLASERRVNLSSTLTQVEADGYGKIYQLIQAKNKLYLAHNDRS